MVLLKVGSDLVYYQLKTKKKLRILNLDGQQMQIQKQEFTLNRSEGRETLFYKLGDGADSLIDLDYEVVLAKYPAKQTFKVVQVDWIPSQTTRAIIRLLDQPTPIIQRLAMVNLKWVVQKERKITDITDVSCFKIDEDARLVLVGTSKGLV
jgi:hypothetical protein